MNEAEGSFDVAWDREPRGGFFSTLASQWRDPAFFARLPTGRVWRAVGYAVLSYLPVLALFHLAVGMLPSTNGTTPGSSFVCTAVGGALAVAPPVVFVVATLIFGCARLAGASTTHDELLRATAYAQGYVFVLLPWTLIIPLAPNLGRQVVFGTLAASLLVMIALQTRGLAAFLGGRAGLPSARAWSAAASPAVLAGTLAVALFLHR